ncbi:hypothetical protein EAG_07992 [Camponotus floridanus]|uniref:Uncharacterized protein n=1 Tax=Camponotus floridanus TaxID=104421 RepID=E2AIB7_CAMFO|nr:hypothetical protein EAG_07992 [Camponotus floridanus]
MLASVIRLEDHRVPLRIDIVVESKKSVRTRIQRLVEGVGDTNEVREGEEDTENLVQEERQGDGVRRREWEAGIDERKRKEERDREEAVALDHRLSAGIGLWAQPLVRPGWTNESLGAPDTRPIDRENLNKLNHIQLIYLNMDAS